VKTLAELRGTIPHSGIVTWIGIRPGRREPVKPIQSVKALVGLGLEGDRRSQGEYKPDADRLVTLIQEEHLAVIAAIQALEKLDPALLRRNIAVKGVNLLALKDREFRVGNSVFHGTGPCPPCSRMEEVLGTGGYNAMRGHGGITARIVEAGEICVGDPVFLPPDR